MVKMNKLVVNKIEEGKKRASKRRNGAAQYLVLIIFRPILHHSAHHPSLK